jgi:hypothetical protein
VMFVPANNADLDGARVRRNKRCVLRFAFLVEFDAGSTSAQTGARTTGAFSPMPTAKTSVSDPLSRREGANPLFASWQNSATASTARPSVEARAEFRVSKNRISELWREHRAAPIRDLPWLEIAPQSCAQRVTSRKPAQAPHRECPSLLDDITKA